MSHKYLFQILPKPSESSAKFLYYFIQIKAYVPHSQSFFLGLRETPWSTYEIVGKESGMHWILGF